MAFVYRAQRSTELVNSITPASVGPGAYLTAPPKVIAPSPAPFTTTAVRCCTSAAVQFDEKPIQFAAVDRPLSCRLPATVSFISNVKRFVTVVNDTPPSTYYRVERFQRRNTLNRDFAQKKRERRAHTANPPGKSASNRLSAPSIPSSSAIGYVEDSAGRLLPISPPPATAPSPGTYNPQYGLTKPDIGAGAVSFGRDTRERPMNSLSETSLIGPGYYHLQSALRTAESGPTIRSSFLSTTDRLPIVSLAAAIVPGVGTYTISGGPEDTTTFVAHHFGSTAERLGGANISDTPAPGQYNTPNPSIIYQPRGGSVFVSQSDRFQSDRLSSAPAVGQYYKDADWVDEYRRTHFSRSRTLGGVGEERFGNRSSKSVKKKSRKNMSADDVSIRGAVRVNNSSPPGMAAFTSKTNRFPPTKSTADFMLEPPSTTIVGRYQYADYPSSSFASYRHTPFEDRQKTPGPGTYDGAHLQSQRGSESARSGRQWFFGEQKRNVFPTNAERLTPLTDNHLADTSSPPPSMLLKKTFNVTFQ